MVATLLDGAATARQIREELRHEVSSLTAGVANTVTYGNILEFLRLYESDGDYSPTIAVGTSAVVAKFDTSTFGSANAPTFGPLGIAMLAGQASRPESRLVPPMYARARSGERNPGVPITCAVIVRLESGMRATPKSRSL